MRLLVDLSRDAITAVQNTSVICFRKWGYGLGVAGWLGL